jgi:hypothetical protein
VRSEPRSAPISGVVVGVLIPALGLVGVPFAWAAPPEHGETTEAPAPEPAVAPEPEPTVAPAPAVAPEPGAAPEQAVDPSNAGKSAPELFSEGRNAYTLGEYEQAVSKFEAAWLLSNEPALLFNLGQAYWQWHVVKPELEYLRRAAKLFENYDGLSRDEPGYDPAEVQAILAAIDAQITAAEQAELIRAQVFATPPPGLDHAALRAQQRLRTTKALTISGSVLIALGSLTLLTGVAGLIIRGAAGFSLDQTGGGEAGRSNPNSAADDARLRSTYSLGGQLGFAGLIAGAALLPVGISLRVTGGARAKRDRQAGDKLTVGPGGGLLTVQF